MNRAALQTINTEKTLFVGLSSLCLFLFVLYIYFVSASVTHVVVRAEINQEISKIASEISELEAKYIAAQHTVSTKIATLQGFVETTEKIFIDKTPSSLVLSTPQNR